MLFTRWLREDSLLNGMLINGHYVPLVEEIETTTRDGYANVAYWDGGTMV